MWTTEIVALLRNGTVKQVGTIKCFEVDEDTFLKVFTALPKNADYPMDFHISQAGFENFLVRLSSLDKEEYGIITKAKPVLDDLWIEMLRNQSSIEIVTLEPKEKPEDAKK